MRPCGGIFDLDSKEQRLQEVQRELEDPTLWQDPEKAKALNRERSLLEETVHHCHSLHTHL